jgi:hypothetical protein
MHGDGAARRSQSRRRLGRERSAAHEEAVMAVKWETVQAGDVLYDVHSYRMGNTTMRSMGCWEVRVRSIDHANGTAVVSWNGNRDETWCARQITKLRRKEPEFEETMFGGQRIKRRTKSEPSR